MPTKDEYDKYMKGNWEGSEKYCDEHTMKDLREFGFVALPSSRHMLTPEGLNQLRMLEDLRRKDFTLIASVVAVLISLGSMIISIFF